MTSAYGPTPPAAWRPLAMLAEEAPVWGADAAAGAYRLWYVGKGPWQFDGTLYSSSLVYGGQARLPADVPGATAVSFDVELLAAGGNAVRVVEAISALLECRLRDAHDLVARLPARLFEAVDEETAERAGAALAEAGATVLVGPHDRSGVLASEEVVEAYRSHPWPPKPVSAADYVVLSREALTAALEAERPFRPPSMAQEQSGQAAELMRSLTRLFEGARLVGPGTEAKLHPMAARIGPMLSTNDVVKATRTTRQNLAAQAKKRRLIRLASSERTQWWPTFQFRRAGSKVVAHPGVQALWQALPEGTVSDWDHATWLCSPRHDLGGDAPLDLATDAGAVGRSPLREVVAAYADRLTR